MLFGFLVIVYSLPKPSQVIIYHCYSNNVKHLQEFIFMNAYKILFGAKYYFYIYYSNHIRFSYGYFGSTAIFWFFHMFLCDLIFDF